MKNLIMKFFHYLPRINKPTSAAKEVINSGMDSRSTLL